LYCYRKKMIRPIRITIFIILLLACSTNKKVRGIQEMPVCLDAKIKAMSSDPNEGSPLSVTRYTYKQQTVSYMVSPCCDKFNVVYDSACNILGHPDGGFTGRGDGKMPDFRKEATNEKVIWKINKQE
jgi:hypothetical protein